MLAKPDCSLLKGYPNVHSVAAACTPELRFVTTTQGSQDKDPILISSSFSASFQGSPLASLSLDSLSERKEPLKPCPVASSSPSGTSPRLWSKDVKTWGPRRILWPSKRPHDQWTNNEKDTIPRQRHSDVDLCYPSATKKQASAMTKTKVSHSPNSTLSSRAPGSLDPNPSCLRTGSVCDMTSRPSPASPSSHVRYHVQDVLRCPKSVTHIHSLRSTQIWPKQFRHKLSKLRSPLTALSQSIGQAKSQNKPVSKTVLEERTPSSTHVISVQQSTTHKSTQTAHHAAVKIPDWQVWSCRIIFGSFILAANVALLLTYFFTHRHLYLLAILIFMKSKDLMSTVADVAGLTNKSIKKLWNPPAITTSKTVMNLVCAYNETPEQIMKTVMSLVEQVTEPHKQVICLILDGKDPHVLPYFSSVSQAFRRPYRTWKGSRGELTISTGFVREIPIIVIKKFRNAGKKDSLILGHDLFNYPRPDMPAETLRLRNELHRHFLTSLVARSTSQVFDFVFCTDADSTVHQHAIRVLTDALLQDENAIAACGVLFAELTVPEVEWTCWHLYQQFQYTFGQYVRRQAEGVWGRVTCLPGCITMLKVREEMGAAISEYAHLVTSYNLFEHQVQYLGTDRRLTWCILSQGRHLRSLFVPQATCETVVPDNMEHYLSQRRRWASNAYFNDWFYACGKHQHLITRLFAVIDIVRLSLVFYRVINTGLFLKSLIENFYMLKLTPTLILTKTPAAFFFILALIREPLLRGRIHKLLLGMCINQVLSPLLSVIVFANVVLNMGSQVWGKTGVSSTDVRPVPVVTPQPNTPLGKTWTPNSLATIVRTAVRGLTSGRRHPASRIQSTTCEPAQQDSPSITAQNRRQHENERPKLSELRKRTPVINSAEKP